jgi:hypothetical protein
VGHDPGIAICLQFAEDQFFLSVPEHPGKKGAITENNNDKKGKSGPVKKVWRVIYLVEHDGLTGSR